MSVKAKTKPSRKTTHSEKSTRSKRMLRGLDLAECVFDIYDKFIKLDEISEIYSDTECLSKSDWDKIIGKYQATHWGRFPQTAAMIMNRLIETNKIVQPKLMGVDVPDTTNGYWVELDSVGHVIAYVQL